MAEIIRLQKLATQLTGRDKNYKFGQKTKGCQSVQFLEPIGRYESMVQSKPQVKVEKLHLAPDKRQGDVLRAEERHRQDRVRIYQQVHLKHGG